MAHHTAAARPSFSIIDLGSLLYLGAVWGAAFLFFRIAAPQVGAVWAAEIRLAIGAAVLLKQRMQPAPPEAPAARG